VRRGIGRQAAFHATAIFWSMFRSGKTIRHADGLAIFPIPKFTAV
jgi:hypothetical protein